MTQITTSFIISSLGCCGASYQLHDLFWDRKSIKAPLKRVTAISWQLKFNEFNFRCRWMKIARELPSGLPQLHKTGTRLRASIFTREIPFVNWSPRQRLLGLEEKVFFLREWEHRRAKKWEMPHPYQHMTHFLYCDWSIMSLTTHCSQPHSLRAIGSRKDLRVSRNGNAENSYRNGMVVELARLVVI